MRKLNFLIITALALFVSTGTLSAQKSVSIQTLLNEMINRDELARFPSPDFTCKQFSSYDRASDKAQTHNEPAWFSNFDRTQFIRTEERDGRTEYVMMDTEGPGAIVRFWMTFAGQNCGRGTMRIYIDDMDTPAVEGAAFDILSGNIITEAPLAASVSELTPYENRGHDLYYPIPYAKRIKITYESKYVGNDFGAHNPETECVYYNINYRTYAPSVKVVSFSMNEVKKNQALAAKVNKQLSENYRSSDAMKLSKLDLSADLAPGASKTFEIEGKGAQAIRQLSMQLDAANANQALRSIVLEMAFDGEQTVWVPVGDFFGTGYLPLNSTTWYTNATAEGAMDSYWVMPFEKDCKITLHNYGKEAIKVTASAKYGKWKWDDRSMHFGANWHQYTRISTNGQKVMSCEGNMPMDLNFTELKGKGVYVGDAIALFNTNYGWWGEGDEKVFVDGERFPSHFGTGTEDYYGYAWCRPEVFTGHPFIGQPQGQGSFEPANTINIRLRALDGIPFNRTLKFDLELFHWQEATMNYAPTTFWYMLPGGKSQIAKDINGVQERVALKRSDLYNNKLQLTLEGEGMNLVNKTGGHFEYQAVPEFNFSGGMQAYWLNAEKGAKLTLDFESPFAGTFTLAPVFTLAPNYGSFNIYINDKLVGNVNLNAAQVSTQAIELGAAELKAGMNTMTVEVTALPEKGNAFFGIDKLVLTK